VYRSPSQVYRSRDGEAALDITIHITPKWLPITIRVPYVVIIRFRLMLDRPLIIEQYDHYGPILALPCTVPGVQLLLESVVQPLVGLGITTLAWGMDVIEDVVQVRGAEWMFQFSPVAAPGLGGCVVQPHVHVCSHSF
jgi:hypothetical protein